MNICMEEGCNERVYSKQAKYCVLCKIERKRHLARGCHTKNRKLNSVRTRSKNHVPGKVNQKWLTRGTIHYEGH